MGTIPPRLSMVVLSTPDVGSLRRFYRALGWAEQPGASDELAMFDLGGTTLTLHAEAGSEPRASVAPGSSPTMVVYLPEREAVDAALDVAQAAGASLPSPPVDQPWGGRSAVFADPLGHRWEVLWVPRPAAASGDAAAG